MGVYQLKNLSKEEIIQEMENLMSWERLYILEHFRKEFKDAQLSVPTESYVKNKTLEEVLNCYPIEDIKTYIERLNTTVLPDYLKNDNDYVRGMEKSEKPF